MYERHIWRQDTQNPPLRMHINTYTIVKAEYFYECESDDLCINMYTPYVAATSFFAGEVEIFDFVSERAKRCIAANKEKRWRKNTMMGKFINYKWRLVLYSICTALLV